MARKKLKEIAEGCRLSFPVKDIKSDRKNIRIFITSPENGHFIVQCEESISNKLRNKEITMTQLIECYYNPRERMIELNDEMPPTNDSQEELLIQDIW